MLIKYSLCHFERNEKSLEKRDASYCQHDKMEENNKSR